MAERRSDRGTRGTHVGRRGKRGLRRDSGCCSSAARESRSILPTAAPRSSASGAGAAAARPQRATCLGQRPSAARTGEGCSGRRSWPLPSWPASPGSPGNARKRKPRTPETLQRWPSTAGLSWRLAGWRELGSGIYVPRRSQSRDKGVWTTRPGDVALALLLPRNMAVVTSGMHAKTEVLSFGGCPATRRAPPPHPGWHARAAPAARMGWTQGRLHAGASHSLAVLDADAQRRVPIGSSGPERLLHGVGCPARV